MQSTMEVVQGVLKVYNSFLSSKVNIK